jgi:phage tail-like protein
MYMTRTGATGLAQRRRAPAESTGPIRVDHAAGQSRAYPGEMVVFHTRLSVRERHAGAVLRISLPPSLHLEEHSVTPKNPDASLHTEDAHGTQTLVWTVRAQLEPGMQFEHQVRARVEPVAEDTRVESQAKVIDEEGQILAQERASLIVETKGRYLQYLPSIYEEDDLMGRFLMLFESFWTPIAMQIEGVSSYFDPELTPSAMLPWLASWVGASLDTRLPESHQRHLVSAALSLYRRRGTKAALKEFLEIYSGGRVAIVEHRAADLRLGRDSRLGHAIALGTGNRPHTFTVHVRLPASAWLASSGWGEEEAARAQRLLESIINAEKPAHTGYQLQIELANEGEIA